ncbi:MAG: TIGR03936 family radical SAM-associated protein, partial [Acidobacteriota bacterium]|nr:TIGR03936 family radical SAM-associated protein [Acidobacteriota bacterium]
WGDCRGCGIPGNYEDIKLAGIPAEEEQPVDVHWPRADGIGGPPGNPASSDPAPAQDVQAEGPLVQITLLPAVKAADSREKDKPSAVPALAPSAEKLPSRPYLVHYRKEGPARLLSHLNVLKLLERALIRCDVRLKFTEGFNPRPKFTASPAIPLGMSSRSEYLRFEAFGELSESLAAQLNDCLVEGLEVQTVEAVEEGKKVRMTQPLQVSYRAWLPDGATLAAPAEVAELTGRVHDLISHLADHDRGNAFYCNAPEHERIADLRVVCEEPLSLSFTLSLDPETGSMMKAKNLLGEVLGCPETLLSRFRFSKESLSFEASAAAKPASPAAHP